MRAFALGAPYNSDSITDSPLRAMPTQNRSAVTLSKIIDSAAVAICDRGSLRLTTTLVAEYSGRGVGTIYRYFPDRMAIVEAICTRNIAQFLLRCLPDISNRRHLSWKDAFAAVVEQMQHSFVSEPGFASLRFGDRFDFDRESDEPRGIILVAREISASIDAHFPGLKPRQLASAVEESLVVGEAVLVRAFRHLPAGDPALLAEAQSVACSHLARRYGS